MTRSEVTQGREMKPEEQSEARKGARRRQTPRVRSLAELRLEEARCTRCPLYRYATQVVPGEGPRAAQLMLVGEQPGDREDLSGRPFVGPAGAILDRALKEAVIERAQVYVTNAVKHFKFELRGKRRLHKRPNFEELLRCQLWLESEIEIVKPSVIVALGATAARSVLGRSVTVSTARRAVHSLAKERVAFVTIHPSFLLRQINEADKEREYRAFVADLCRARKAL